MAGDAPVEPAGHRGDVLEGLVQIVLWACEMDVAALKPGNVGRHGDGHRMTVEQFIASAFASAPALCRARATVGERIEGAVMSTLDEVGCNTNLGIVLLLAPMVQGVIDGPGQPTDSVFTALRLATAQVLGRLTVGDAQAAFRAIAAAQPAGLGQRDEDDVRSPAKVTLLEAMQSVAEHDRIARQYANAFSDVFDLGVPAILRALRAGESWEDATTAAYMTFLAAFPDTHVLRKHGPEAARLLMAERTEIARQCLECQNQASLREVLLDWDRSLKDRGINPGTSADLTVASAFAARLGETLSTT